MKRSHKILGGAAAGLVVVGLIGHQLMGHGGDVRLTAVFDNASPLVKGNVVRTDGVDVGSITGIKLSGGKAYVTMEVKKGVFPLHSDAKATITTEDLLGERFVNLDPGTSTAPVMADQTSMDDQHTARVVDLQDVLNSVDTPTSVALSALLTQTGEGLAGNGGNAAQTLAGLAPTMTEANKVSSILKSQNKLLGQLVDAAQPAASALAGDNGQQLNQLVAGATTSLQALAGERDALSAALTQLPQTVSNAQQALAHLADVTGPATKTLASIRPVTDNLTAISGELGRFSDAADPALTSLPPVLQRANQLLDEAAPVVHALRPTSSSLVPVSAAADKLSTDALSGKNLVNLMEFVKGWSLATSDYDAVSHYFKAMIPLSPAALGDTVQGLLPGVPASTVKQIKLPTAPKLPLPGRSGSSSSTTPSAPSAPPSQSATGLSQQQEGSLLGQLLGGLL